MAYVPTAKHRENISKGLKLYHQNKKYHQVKGKSLQKLAKNWRSKRKTTLNPFG